MANIEKRKRLKQIMAPIATVCNNKMKKIVTEPMNETEELAIPAASSPPAVEASLSKYILVKYVFAQFSILSSIEWR